MTQSILKTEDNSHTLYSDHFGAHYHSIHGAIEESMHVFISAGLYKMYRQKKKKLVILEMGFGTGLNVLLSFLEAKELDIEISYTTLESHPISLEIAEQLNYPNQLSNPESKDIFSRIHGAKWEQKVQLSPSFYLSKIKTDIQSYSFSETYDLVYYDAFAPSCQSQLWEKSVHLDLYGHLNPGGILVTYCTQGAFRRMLEGLGYYIERLNGPGRKREMLRATKY